MFGDRLKKLRIEKELRQTDLAKIIGVSDGAIGMYENNKRNPDFDIIKKIAKYFDVSIDYLLGSGEDTFILEGSKLPLELREIGIEYMEVAKHMQDKKIPIGDIMKIIDILKKE